MNSTLRKLIRTIVVYFPYLQQVKPQIQRSVYSFLKISFEKELHALQLFSSSEDDLFLDIGGNEGFAIDAILLFKKKCRIYSFEPIKDLAYASMMRYKQQPNVTIFPFGLGDSEGEYTLYTPAYRNSIFYPLSSFSKEHAESWLRRNEIFGFNERSYQLLESVCTIKKLDDLKINPFFIKLDVQGFELFVLKGGEHTIRNARPIIFIGPVRGDQCEYLQSLGYRHFIFDSSSKTLKVSTVSEQNSYFIPEEKINIYIPQG